MQRPRTLYVLTATAVVFSLFLGVFFLLRMGLPSSDVVARENAQRPIISVSDYEPGDVELILLDGRRVIVWRRNEADKILAAIQNNPETWQYQSSRVAGQAEPVFADDANLTLDDEWFFALAEFPNKYQHLLLREGEFEGFWEGRYGAHFDLAGRIRRGGGSYNLTVIQAEYVQDEKGIQLYLGNDP